MNDAGETTIKVLEEEKRLRKEQDEKLDTMFAGIERVLIENNATWMEWTLIISKFNSRNSDVIPNLTMAFIKQRQEQIPTL